MPSPAGSLALAIPDGVWDHNKAFGCRVALEHAILPLRERRFPDAKAFAHALNHRGPRNFLAAIVLPATSNIIERAFHTTVACDLGRVACAVEVFRLSEGRYPETLDELLPAQLDTVPGDLLAPDRKLSYAPGLQGHRYRVYSVGQNGTDEGGEVVFEEGSKVRRGDFAQGDWAWGYRFEMPSDE